MNRNYLLIVEGEQTEKNIFSNLFIRYGFNIVKRDKISIPLNNANAVFDQTDFSLDKDNIVIIQGPRNRISEFIDLYNVETESLDSLFLAYNAIFSGIFLIYDVDHTSKEKLEKMFDKFNDESSSGLLLVSSPCIEILGDVERKEDIKTEHLKTYKKERNCWATSEHLSSYQDYLIDHFEELALFYLEQNTTESNDKNIMNHPAFVIEKINRLNERSYVDKNRQPVWYRYFTTVVYVCIAYIMGLTKEIENADTVRSFLKKHLSDS